MVKGMDVLSGKKIQKELELGLGYGGFSRKEGS